MHASPARAFEPLAVPLLAQRFGASVDAVYAMPGEAFGAWSDEFADWITATVAIAAEAPRGRRGALDPARMRERMMRRVASDQS